MTPAQHRGELFRAWPEWDLDEGRRAEARRRLDLYRGDYKGRVCALVRDRIADQETAHEVCKHVNTAHGLVAAVANACAVVYQRGVRRELRSDDAAAAAAFAEIVTESGVAAVGPALNALSWVMGPVVMMPHVGDVRGERRLLVTLATADRYAVRLHRSAPDVLEAVLWQRDDGVFVEVDDKRWRYWTAQGDPLDDGAWDRAHPLGYCPATPLRARPWIAYDWTGTTDHRGLCDAALEVAFMHALGRWVRTQNAGPATEITAPPEKYAKLQALGHPSRPLVFDAMPQEVRVQVHDRTVDPRHYLSEIQAQVNAAVIPYGIPPSAVTFVNDQSNWGVLSLSMTPGALATQRDAQAPLLWVGEVDLWRIVCDVVRASDHPLAGAIPPRDEVKRILRVAIPDLSDPKEQSTRMDVFERKLPHGLASAEDLLMESRPELTRAEAREEIQERRRALAEQYEELARRNLPADAQRAIVLASATGGVESVAQAQGREGGQVSGVVRRERTGG